MSQFHAVRVLEFGRHHMAVDAQLRLLRLQSPDQYRLTGERGKIVVGCDSSNTALKLVQKLAAMGATVELVP